MNFIAFEGIDGTGKSTISKMVAEELGWLKTPKRTVEYDKIISQAKKIHGANETTLHSLYVQAMCNTSSHVQELMNQNKGVVVARWIGGEVASHRFYSYLKSTTALNFDYKSFPLIIPDIGILLRASCETREKRILQRSASLAKNDSLSLNPKASEFVEEASKEFYKKLIIVDTDDLNLNQVCDQVLSELRA